MNLKLLVFSPFYPPHIGGLESHADEFNKHLSKQGAQISVFTPRFPFDAPEEEKRYDTVFIYRFPAFEPIHNYPVPKFWLPKFWQLLRKASSPKPDLLISRTRFFSTSFFALFFSKVRHIPLIHIEHGSDFARFNSSFKTLLGKCYDRSFGFIVLRFADSVIANSEASAKFVKKLSGRTASVIYRGIETENILKIEITRNVLREKHNQCVIGFVGRLIDGKGVPLLFSALSRIKRGDFVCFIVGDGPERTYLESLSEKFKLSKNIQFFGHQNHHETIALLKTCDIIVNPSYTEGLPTSVIEASLCKKAIVATHVGGTSEIISGKDDGFLIPAGDAKTLQEKISYLLDHPEIRERFGKNAFLAVQNKFDWNSSIEKYLQLFKKILKRNPLL